MRIWDLSPTILCRKHLLGEHRELHSIWTVITQHKKGYAHHPETLRWIGKLKALANRHEQLVKEMKKRNYRHHNELDLSLATGDAHQTTLIHTLAEQKQILRDKHCDCRVN
ncbi:MAG TPA: pyrimidine dimer DNA glycosylase/endonuclease V [Candidatus Saccharimonadales bacterium]|nr:pyrimidine dimer DNA glycosylase/endonuclease V [Candidatus Saccharimonadales bacterium]